MLEQNADWCLVYVIDPGKYVGVEAEPAVSELLTFSSFSSSMQLVYQ